MIFDQPLQIYWPMQIVSCQLACLQISDRFEQRCRGLASITCSLKLMFPLTELLNLIRWHKCKSCSISTANLLSHFISNFVSLAIFADILRIALHDKSYQICHFFTNEIYNWHFEERALDRFSHTKFNKYATYVQKYIHVQCILYTIGIHLHTYTYYIYI